MRAPRKDCPSGRSAVRVKAGGGRGRHRGRTGETDIMAAENVQTFTDGNFEQSVIKAGGAVLVDFWAGWCGPCIRLAPTVEALATDYAGKITVGKMNVDENPNTPAQFQIQSIPTLLLFKGGRVVESVVGLAHKDDLKKVIDKHL